MLNLAILAPSSTPDDPHVYGRTIHAWDCDRLELDALGWLVWKPIGKPVRRVGPSLIWMVEERETVEEVRTSIKNTLSEMALEAVQSLPTETFSVSARDAHYSASFPETEEEQPAMAPPKRKPGRPRKT